MQGRIETRALREAERLTQVFSGLAVVPNLTRAELEGPLSPAAQAELDAALAHVEHRRAFRLLHVNLFAADGTTVYSDVGARVGDVVDGDDFKRARAGALVSEIERETGDRGRAGRHVARGLRAAAAAGQRRGGRRDRVLRRLRPDRGRDPRRHAHALPAARGRLRRCSGSRSSRSCGRLGPPAPPGAARHADGAAEPREPAPARRPIDERRARVRRARRAAADRPRPLQGGQRHARARSRRHTAARRGRSPPRPRCAAATRSRGSAATSSPCCCPTCPTAARPPSWPRACSQRWSGRSSCAE